MDSKNTKIKSKKPKLPILALLLLILGLFSPIAIMNDIHYTIYDLYLYSEQIPIQGGKSETIVNLLETILLFIIVTFLISALFGLLSLKFQKTVLIASFFTFLSGVSLIVFFAIFGQLSKLELIDTHPNLGYSPFIFFIAASIFLLHHYRVKSFSKESNG